MPEDKKIDLDATIKTQLASLTLEKGQWETEKAALLEENKGLKKQCIELATVIENELKSDLMIKVMAKGDYKQSDLEPLKVEELQKIDATLSKVKGGLVAATYKNIRVNTDTDNSRMTVGNLYGRTREQILAMKGDH